MNQQAERRVGTVIGGKWRVDALLGSGSMAAVYAVTHRNGARAALKILHPTLCTDPAVCERFLGEGYLTNSVKHPGIVRVLDDGVTDDGCVFLVMDLLEGQTLEQLRQARGGRLSVVEALDIADSLMDVLFAVHTAGIIHRDLKPQNVFICDDGTVKLLDFGVARVFDRTSQSKLSMFGLVLGTPSFMSPEQALGSRDKVDHRSDIWSLGATMFTSLTGETVHLGANVQARLLAAATVKARSITMAMQDLPKPIASAIDAALRFKKEDRWQGVDVFRRALREARSVSGLGKPQSVAPPALDMSLDEPSHEPAPRTSNSQHPSSGQTSEGTFIGIGNGAGKVSAVVGDDGSLPPPPITVPPPAIPAPGIPGARANLPRPVTRSSFPTPRTSGPPLAQRTSGAPPPLPQRTSLSPNHTVPMAPFTRAPGANAVVRGPVPGGPPGQRSPSRPDVEGSIPAYGSTLKLVDDIDGAIASDGNTRPRRSVGVWVAAFVLVVGGLGGAGFFVARQKAAASVAPANAPPATETAPPSAAPTTPIPSIVPTPTPESPAPPATSAAVATAVLLDPKPPVEHAVSTPTVTPPRPHYLPRPRPTAPPVATDPPTPSAPTTFTPTPPADPKPPPTGADPFATPD